MKISFFIGPKEKKIPQPEPFEIDYKYQGHICSVIVHGDINQPQVLVVPPTNLPILPISKYLFFMNISWSVNNGFEYNLYTDTLINTSLNSNVDKFKIRGGSKIQINNGLISLTFKAEVEKLEDSQQPEKFITECSNFGIKLVNINFDNIKNIYGLKAHRSNFYNVEFSNCQINYVDFQESTFTGVTFLNCIFETANFTGCKFYPQVKFSECKLKKSIFDNATVINNRKTRIEEGEEILIFSDCDLSESKFTKAKLNTIFDKSNLFNTDFSEATIIDSKFYDCTLEETIFSQSRFTSYQSPTDKSRNANQIKEKFFCCRIGPKSKSMEKEKIKGKIINCHFDNSFMRYTDISNNRIEGTKFRSTDLSKSQLSECEIIETHFTTINHKTNLSYVDASESNFQECLLNEANFYYARMIKTEIKNCQLIRTSFRSANMIQSKIVDCNLTGCDFRYTDLTLVTLDKCHLHGAKFFQTQRGGLDLKVVKVENNENNQNSSENLNVKAQNNENNQNSSKNATTNQIGYTSSCDIKSIDWSPEGDGQIQLDTNSFLSIISGDKSPIAVVSNLSKEAAQFILNNFATATAKSAGEDLNDSSINNSGELNESQLRTGDIENKAFIETDEGESSDDYEASYNKSDSDEDDS
jgi:uncharacterized protein YjbI with pentapeptide repeats